MRKEKRFVINRRYYTFIFYFVFYAPVFVPFSFAQDVGDIRDIRGPVPFTNHGLWLLLLIASSGILAFFIFKKIKGKRVNAVVDLPKPAWEIARIELETLKEKNFPEQGLVKLFYSELSLILRRYIERRFLIKAPEMTTEEFLGSLGHTATLNSSQKSRLRDFLVSCDMVKFAKQGATPEQMHSSFDLVGKFVEETILKEHMST
ncbi:MAG: hypothetical protein AB1650_04535 [Candidatus Omnitrophota bacterium]